MNGEIRDRTFGVKQPIVAPTVRQHAGEDVSISSSRTGDHGGNCRTFVRMSFNAAAPVQVPVSATRLEQ